MEVLAKLLEFKYMADNDDPGGFKYAQIGLELAVGVGLGFWCGYRLDLRFATIPWFTLAGSAVGFAAGLYLVVMELPGEKNFKAKTGGQRPKL